MERKEEGHEEEEAKGRRDGRIAKKLLQILIQKEATKKTYSVPKGAERRSGRRKKAKSRGIGREMVSERQGRYHSSRWKAEESCRQERGFDIFELAFLSLSPLTQVLAVPEFTVDPVNVQVDEEDHDQVI